VIDAVGPAGAEFARNADSETPVACRFAAGAVRRTASSGAVVVGTLHCFLVAVLGQALW